MRWNMAKETLIFKNKVKLRIPVPPVGGAHQNRKDKKTKRRPKITVENWEKVT